MQEKFLVINGGSSSLKFSLFDDKENVIASGKYEEIGSENCTGEIKNSSGKTKLNVKVSNHGEALFQILENLKSLGIIESFDEIKAVGHRILHGGEFYDDSVVIDDVVMNNIRSITNLGPLHLPGELSCVEYCSQLLPLATEVAVFDTAFHQTIPEENYLYAVPYDWYTENGVRKYGFHGTSHKYITERMKDELGKDNVNLIICHLGNGSSLSAIKDGKCIDTTMGLTPLDGLVMGTRSGSIDPSILEFICKEKGLTIEQVTNILNKQSGLLGICGANDLRIIEANYENGDEKAKLAIKLLVNSIVKSIAAYYFELEGNIDAIVMTAGVGENSYIVRGEVIDKLSKVLPITLDIEENNKTWVKGTQGEAVISTEDSKIPVRVLKTNEELMIAKDTKRLYELKKDEKTRKLTK